MDIFGIDKTLAGLKRGADKFGGKIAAKVVRTMSKRVNASEAENGYAPKKAEPYGTGQGGAETAQESHVPTQALNVKIGIPPAQLRQQNKLDFLKRELPLSQDAAEREAIEYEIAAIEKELAAMPHGDPDARQEKKTSFANDAISNPFTEGTDEHKAYAYHRSTGIGHGAAMELMPWAKGKEKKNVSPEFEAKLRELAKANGKSEDEMKALWRKHEEINDSYDQSPTMEEFISWNKLKNCMENAKDAAFHFQTEEESKQKELQWKDMGFKITKPTYHVGNVYQFEYELKNSDEDRSKLEAIYKQYAPNMTDAEKAALEKQLDASYIALGFDKKYGPRKNAPDNAAWQRKADEIDRLQREILDEMGKDKAGDKGAFERVKGLQAKVKALHAELYDTKGLSNATSMACPQCGDPAKQTKEVFSDQLSWICPEGHKFFTSRKNEGEAVAAPSAGATDSSTLGFESAQKTTTAQRSRELPMLSKCLACGHESPNAWNGKCEGCGAKNAKDAAGGTGKVKVAENADDGKDQIVADAKKMKKDGLSEIEAIDMLGSRNPNASRSKLETIVGGVFRGSYGNSLGSDAEQVGRDAFKAGKTSTPAHDPAVMEMIKKSNGTPGAANEILDGWIKGWHGENLKNEAPKPEGEKKSYTFTDKTGESATFNADDEDGAWEQLANSFGVSVNEAKDAAKLNASGKSAKIEPYRNGGFVLTVTDASGKEVYSAHAPTREELIGEVREQGAELKNSDTFNVHCPKCDALTEHEGVQTSTESRRKCLDCGYESEGKDGKMVAKNASDKTCPLCEVDGKKPKLDASGVCPWCKRTFKLENGGYSSCLKGGDHSFEKKGEELVCVKCGFEWGGLPLRSNAGILGQSAWTAASLDERADWLELARQDINAATQAWVDLSQDQRVALQDVKDMPATVNNSTDLRGMWQGTDAATRAEMLTEAGITTEHEYLVRCGWDSLPSNVKSKMSGGLNNSSGLDWDMLAREYAKFDTIPFDYADKLLAIIHSADDNAIKELAGRDLKFISKVARNEMFRRGLKNEGGKSATCEAPGCSSDQVKWCNTCGKDLCANHLCSHEKKNASDKASAKAERDSLDSKIKDLTAKLHSLESETGAGGRDTDAKRTPILREIEEAEKKRAEAHARYISAHERDNAAGRPCPSCESTRTKPAGADMKESLVCQDCMRTFYDTDSGYHPEDKTHKNDHGAGWDKSAVEEEIRKSENKISKLDIAIKEISKDWAKKQEADELKSDREKEITILSGLRKEELASSAKENDDIAIPEEHLGADQADLEEIARHAEGIEHEVGEMLEEDAPLTNKEDDIALHNSGVVRGASKYGTKESK